MIESERKISVTRSQPVRTDFGNGVEVVITNNEPQRPFPGDVAYHEALHTVAARRIIIAPLSQMAPLWDR